MYIGGFHLFAGLFFLLLSTLLVFFYLAALFVTAVGLRWLWDKFHQSPKPMVLSRDRVIRSACKGFVYTLIFLSSIYVFQRLKWCGAENAHRQAKEYFVAGQPLLGLRLILTGPLNPDNPVLQPLHGLQRLIYQQGIKHLPDDDGEIGVWTDLWFHSPYMRRMHDPYGSDKFHPSPTMRHLLDQIYESIEIMATRPFADARVERDLALKHLSGAAFYFSLNKGFYEDSRVGSRRPLLQRADFVAKTENLHRWMTELRQRWIDAGIYQQIKTDTPKVELIRQLVMIHFSSDLLYAALYRGEFSCRHPLIPVYIEARRDFTDPTGPDYVWGRLHAREPQQAKLLYGMAIDAYSVSFFKYALGEYCSLDVPGEERFYRSRDKAFSKKLLVPGLKSIFHKEIKLIEEGIDER